MHWFQLYYASDKLARHRGRALDALRAHGSDLPERAELERQVQALKRELALATANNHRRNVALDALGYVWCDGGCSGGTFRYAENAGREVTEDLVVEAERNAQRLRRWLTNHNYRAERGVAAR